MTMWDVRQIYEREGGGAKGWRRILRDFYREVKLFHLELLQLREAAAASAHAPLTRKAVQARLVTHDIPLDSFKDDLERKQALRRVMGLRARASRVAIRRSPDRSRKRRSTIATAATATDAVRIASTSTARRPAHWSPARSARWTSRTCSRPRARWKRSGSSRIMLASIPVEHDSRADAREGRAARVGMRLRHDS